MTDSIPADVRDFLAAVTPARRARDAQTLLGLFAEATGETPTLWGTIVGYGRYHYRYESGRESDAPAAGFAPRRAATSVYLNDGVGTYAERLAQLGPHTSGVGCLYLKDLEHIDLAVLAEIVARSHATLTAGVFPSGTATTCTSST